MPSSKKTFSVIVALVILSMILSPFSLSLSEPVPALNEADAQLVVADPGDIIQNTLSAVSSGLTYSLTQANWAKEYFLDPFAWIVAKTLLRKLTSDIVTYINNGFKVNGHAGNAGFLKDPGQFFADVADESAGSFIYTQLGTFGQVICSPFDLQLRLALQLNFGAKSYSDQARCTLSGIVGNIKGSMDNFFGGNFNQGGWNGWFSMTQNSNNNPYGAYINASEALTLQSASGKSLQLMDLNQGKGILSFKTCTAYSLSNPSQCVKTADATPGSLIEDQLSESLHTDMHNLEIADEFNEIITALVGQFLGSIFGGTGLAGAGSSDAAKAYFNEDLAAGQGGVPDLVPPPKDTSCTPGQTKNFAAGQKAQQVNSGDKADGGPTVVVDGSKSSTGTSGISISDAVNPWWQVDLGASRTINEIRIYGRPGGGDNESLAGLSVYISDAPFTATDTPETLQKKTGVITLPIANPETVPIDLTGITKKGRYVRLQKDTGEDKQYLQLVEVEIVGTTTAADCPASGDDGGGGSCSITSPIAIPAGATMISTSGNFGSNLQSAINNAPSGATLVVPAGTYTSGAIKMKSGVRLAGAQGGAMPTITFTVGSGGDGTNNTVAIDIGGLQNVTIDGLALRSNNGLIKGDNISNVKIVNNDLMWGYNGGYYQRIAVRSTGSSGLAIENNYFHDSPASDRNIDLFNTNNDSYSYNRLYNINDGGHIDGLHHHLRVVGNVGSRIHRMGIELQSNLTTRENGGDDILVDSNVFTNWRNPDGLSFGLSVPPQYAANVRITNNYLSTGPERVTVQDKHYGYGIEAGFVTSSGMVSNNIMIGPWVTAIVAMDCDTPLKDNKAYGTNPWGPFGTEPGNHTACQGGQGNIGTIKDLGGNQGNLPESSAPPPPTVSQAPQCSGGAVSSGGTIDSGGTAAGGGDVTTP